MSHRTPILLYRQPAFYSCDQASDMKAFREGVVFAFLFLHLFVVASESTENGGREQISLPSRACSPCQYGTINKMSDFESIMSIILFLI